MQKMSNIMRTILKIGSKLVENISYDAKPYEMFL